MSSTSPSISTGMRKGSSAKRQRYGREPLVRTKDTDYEISEPVDDCGLAHKPGAELTMPKTLDSGTMRSRELKLPLETSRMAKPVRRAATYACFFGDFRANLAQWLSKIAVFIRWPVA